jgi:MerR family transcriptional regulator, light-induced transcriptional regulator
VFGKIEDAVYQVYLSALLAGDRPQCMEVLNRFLREDLSVETLYTDLFQRSLYRIGELWEQNRISVAVEHLATAITESLLTAVYPQILDVRALSGRKAIISCSVNEFHQVGARMVADVLEVHGWDAWFLGANTPVEDLLQLIDEKRPDALGLSVSIYFNMGPLTRMMEKVRSHYKDLEILVGGQAFRWGGTDIAGRFPNTTYIPSLHDLIQTIDTGP